MLQIIRENKQHMKKRQFVLMLIFIILIAGWSALFPYTLALSVKSGSTPIIGADIRMQEEFTGSGEAYTGQHQGDGVYHIELPDEGIYSTQYTLLIQAKDYKAYHGVYYFGKGTELDIQLQSVIKTDLPVQFMTPTPDAVPFDTPVIIQFRINLERVSDYRYKLGLPMDLAGGIEYNRQSWSDWMQESSQAITFSDFEAEGAYTFELEYKTKKGERYRLSRTFQVYKDKPVIQFNSPIPARVKLKTPVVFDFTVDSRRASAYRYKLQMPIDWTGGLKYMLQSWSNWHYNNGQSITFDQFNQQGEYTFKIEYKDQNGKKHSLDRHFEVYLEMPVVEYEDLNIDFRYINAASTEKEKYRRAAEELDAAYKMYYKKYEYQVKSLHLTQSPEDMLKVILGAPAQELAQLTIPNQPLVQGNSKAAQAALDKAFLKGDKLAARTFMKKLLAPLTVYNIIKQGATTLILLYRNVEANKAISMAAICNILRDHYHDLYLNAPETPQPLATKPQTTQPKSDFIDWVFVGGGEFNMGRQSQDAHPDEQPVHTVRVDDFWISRTEVTNEQYCRFLNATNVSPQGQANGKLFIDMQNEYCQINYTDRQFVTASGKKNYPVIEVTWYGARAFCEWAGGRLPTEAEWEYAARGGQKSRGYTYSGSSDLDAVGWYSGNSGGRTHPVMEKSANELGLYDMSGNVLEWCHDWYDSDYYGNSPRNNPKGPSSGSFRVLRGGSWSYNARNCRVAFRSYFTPGFSDDLLGFRLAQDGH